MPPYGMTEHTVSRTTKDIECPTCHAAPGKSCRSVKGNKPLPDMHTARRLISINEAARRGHPRLRKPKWVNPLDHIKIDIVDGELQPDLHLYSPGNRQMNGRDPVDMRPGDPFIPPESLDAAEFEVYTGPPADSDEYRAAVRAFEDMVARTNVQRD